MLQASSILGCDKITVRKFFPYNNINILPDPLSLDKELMEIRFRNVTVTYVINKKDICCMGYLFLDDLSDLDPYLNVCQKYFKIVTYNSWKHKNCYIELKKEDTDFFFVFS